MTSTQWYFCSITTGSVNKQQFANNLLYQLKNKEQVQVKRLDIFSNSIIFFYYLLHCFFFVKC